MILSQQTTENEVEEMLEFYKQLFDSVDLVRCLKCGVILCLELRGADPMGMQVNDLGKIIVPIGDALQSTRTRLDETGQGERMPGYQCGNAVENPFWAPAEVSYQAEVRKAEKEQTAELKKYETAHRKATAKVKPGEPIPDYTPPLVRHVPHHGVPQFIECGNDTRIGAAERGHVPTGRSQTTLSPFEKMKIAEKIRSSQDKPQVRIERNKRIYETFSVERIK